jgi:anti-sigma B factor antagonist
MERLSSSTLPNGQVLVTARGELDTSDVDEFRAFITTSFARSPQIVVDLEAIEYLDSSILALLISESLEADKHGRRLTVVTGANGLLRSFELKGLMQVMHIAHTLADL